MHAKTRHITCRNLNGWEELLSLSLSANIMPQFVETRHIAFLQEFDISEKRYINGCFYKKSGDKHNKFFANKKNFCKNFVQCFEISPRPLHQKDFTVWLEWRGTHLFWHWQVYDTVRSVVGNLTVSKTCQCWIYRLITSLLPKGDISWHKPLYFSVSIVVRNFENVVYLQENNQVVWMLSKQSFPG